MDTWYTAEDIKGEWKVADRVPKEVASRAPEMEPDSAGQGPEEDGEKEGPSPKVIVSTEPSELISSNGEPEYTPISGTDLLYVSNTDSDVLLHIGNQQHFVLLSRKMVCRCEAGGPLAICTRVKNCPRIFARIQEDSEMGTVLYAVPGTDIAQEAVLDAQIPQTAAVDRRNAKLEVEYDGEPKFEKISGTKMTYAINTVTPVVHVQNEYYACDEAVWFFSDRATGPWRLATSLPNEIYTIPPDSPIYHVTFVHIYHITADTVYVGYTPGYTHTYVYHSTIVYGTGYWWPGWYGRYYYPRPSTWGFHVRWNPWTGWGFGLSYSSGPFRFTIGVGGWYRGGWWGPGRYRGYRRGYRHGYRHGRNAGYRAGYRSGHRNATQQNIYQNKRNQARTTASTATAKKSAMAGGAKKRDNNVFADQNGNVHRKTDQGWQTRTKDGWQSKQGGHTGTERSQAYQSQRQSASSGGRTSTQQLDRSYQARQQGNQRTQSYNSARRSYGSSSMGRSRGGGRGGGRR